VGENIQRQRWPGKKGMTYWYSSFLIEPHTIVIFKLTGDKWALF